MSYEVGFPYRPGDDWIKGQTPPPRKAPWAAARPALRATGQELGGLDDTIVNVVRMAAVGAGAYHGYRRTGSGGWAAAWGLFAGALPILAIPIAVAQGYGKKKGK